MTAISILGLPKFVESRTMNLQRQQLVTYSLQG